ncbi:hypothetical protein [Streptomyces sp. NBC_01618]|uniref:hypothetical protein n=1 Tax=Streptomyces sp. NBC_01618 TaxID=2975900 RepID=UPI003869BE65|nr:hypothetical protein OH735_35695 [Streptomyces sp. NBC_01618]
MSRLLVLCAVLCGLFLMHGAPASAAEGCHGGQAVTSQPPMSMATGAAHTAHTAVPEEHSIPRVDAAVTGMNGESCVSTHARDRLLPLLMALGLVILAVWVLGRLRPAVRGPARRGPPLAGSELLLQVCVART